MKIIVTGAAGVIESAVCRYLVDEIGATLLNIGKLTYYAGKVETELGWRARETFASGLEKTVRWYLDSRAWWGPLRQRVAKGERLGLLADRAAVETGARL